jgi:hypothetical protein
MVVSKSVRRRAAASRGSMWMRRELQERAGSTEHRLSTSGRWRSARLDPQNTSKMEGLC